MKKKIIYIDMDGVLANFRGGIDRENAEWNPPEMYAVSFFRNLKVMPGAREAISTLLNNPKLDVYIASKPVTKLHGLHCATEKYQWVLEYFPELIQKIFLTCDKGHLNGDYLIDDDKNQWGDKFKGTFLHFDEFNPEESWKRMLEYFKKYE